MSTVLVCDSLEVDEEGEDGYEVDENVDVETILSEDSEMVSKQQMASGSIRGEPASIIIIISKAAEALGVPSAAESGLSIFLFQEDAVTRDPPIVTCIVRCTVRQQAFSPASTSFSCIPRATGNSAFASWWQWFK